MIFRSKLSVIIVGCIATYASLTIAAGIPNSVRTLDAHATHLVAPQKDCFEAAKNCLLQVSPFASNRDQREYNVAQICDRRTAQMLYLHKLTLKDQVAERKFLGNSFCDGIVSISDMKLPFAKGAGIQDANDGLLLVEYLQSTFGDMQKLFDAMKKLAAMSASGTYSSTQMANLNSEFQDLLCECNRIAYTTSFNGLSLLDYDHDLNVPIHGGAQNILVKCINMTTSDSGLNIYDLDISTPEGAQVAVKKLPSVKSILTYAVKNLKAIEPLLHSAIEKDATMTTFDIRGEEFVIQQKGELNPNKRKA